MKMMSQDQAAVATRLLGSVATGLLAQLEGKQLLESEVNQFFLGTLTRSKSILRDSARLLEQNAPHQLDTVFILFRTLLDDFCRSFAVHEAQEPIRMVERIDAEAVRQILNGVKESAAINYRVFNGGAIGLQTKDNVEEWEARLASDPMYDAYFEDRGKLKFKRMPKTSDMLKQGENEGFKDSVAHAYLLYGRLSQHVHYSRFTFFLGRHRDVHNSLVGQLEECLFYTYKMLRMHNEYFSRTESVKWDFVEADMWFTSIAKGRNNLP